MKKTLITLALLFSVLGYSQKYATTLEGGEIQAINKLSENWNGIRGLPTTSYENLKTFGIYKVEQPILGENQRKGTIYFDAVNELYKYTVVDFTQEEIENNIKAISEGARFELIQQIAEQQILDASQTEEDDTKLLETQALYPFWEVGLDLTINHKIQAFDGNELKLYRIVQTHTTQSNWHPTVTPALFTRVALSDEILDWVQPTGAQDAYNTGDKVNFEGKVYESVIDANTWSPTAYPAGWNEIN